jgi:hypothetical protein
MMETISLPTAAALHAKLNTATHAPSYLELAVTAVLHEEMASEFLESPAMMVIQIQMMGARISELWRQDGCEVEVLLLCKILEVMYEVMEL